MSKTFCLTVHLENMLKRGPEGCANMFKGDDGISLTGQEAYDKLWKAWLEGYEVLPTCNNHSPKGYCLGHEKGKGG